MAGMFNNYASILSPWSDTTDMDDRRGAACDHDGIAVAGGLPLLFPNVALMSYLGPREPFLFQAQRCFPLNPIIWPASSS